MHWIIIFEMIGVESPEKCSQKKNIKRKKEVVVLFLLRSMLGKGEERRCNCTWET